MRKHNPTTIQFPFAGRTFLITGTLVPYDPGCTSGPPDAWYPAEGGGVDISEIKLSDEDLGAMDGAYAVKIVSRFESFLENSQKTRDKIEEAFYATVNPGD